MNVYYDAGRTAAFTKLGISFKGLFGGAKPAAGAAEGAMGTVARRNAELRAFKPKQLPPMRNMPAEAAAQATAPAAVRTKSAPTQAIDQGQFAQHLSQLGPDKAIQAATQYGAPIQGTSSVLDSLQSMPFQALS